MISKKIRLENLEIVKNLAKKKGWQADWFKVKKALLEKSQPRFFYFPLIDSLGEKLYFKSCLVGRLGLCQRAIKEYKIQEWLGKRDGPVKKVKDFGQEGPIFWYTASYLSLQKGIICQEEDVTPLTLKNIGSLALQIRQLWAIKKKEVPADLLKLLLPPRLRGEIFPGTFKNILKYLKILKGAFRIFKLNWQKKDEAQVLSFFETFKKEISSYEKGVGILVHGDLAPNNIFFGPQTIIFDWESSYWCNNLLLGLGMDLANFYTRCWQRLELGERLIKEVKKSPLIQKPLFLKALRIATVMTVLQKISPMFKYGVYQSSYDQRHFNFLVKILKENLVF